MRGSTNSTQCRTSYISFNHSIIRPCCQKEHSYDRKHNNHRCTRAISYPIYYSENTQAIHTISSHPNPPPPKPTRPPIANPRQTPLFPPRINPLPLGRKQPNIPLRTLPPKKPQPHTQVPPTSSPDTHSSIAPPSPRAPWRREWVRMATTRRARFTSFRSVSREFLRDMYNFAVI